MKVSFSDIWGRSVTGCLEDASKAMQVVALLNSNKSISLTLEESELIEAAFHVVDRHLKAHKEALAGD